MNSPPLTSDPIQFDVRTKRYSWTRPWLAFWDAFKREVDEIQIDEDILDAFGLVGKPIPDSLKASLLSLNQSRQIQQTLSVLIQNSTSQKGLEAAILALSSQRSWSDIRIIQDTFANRIAAAAYPEGSFFISTTAPSKGVVWVARTVSGTRQWIYVSGYWRDTLSNIPTSSLTASDADLLWEVTDYDHVLQWTGSAWTWGPGELGSGAYQLYEDAPNSVGANAWQLCDGSVNVPRLNADGTTTNVTVPDLTTAAYLKGGITSAAVAAASGAVANESTHTHAVTSPTGAPSATVEVQAGAGTTVATETHTHAVTTPTGAGSAHNHGPGSLELRNKQARLYFRR